MPKIKVVINKIVFGITMLFMFFTLFIVANRIRITRNSKWLPSVDSDRHSIKS